MVIAVGLSLLAYVVVTNLATGTSPDVPGQASQVRDEPATLVWQRTGEYRAGHGGIALTVLTYHITSEHIRILYAVDSSASGVQALPASIALTDELGQEYVATNSILGSSLGVVGGVLTAEPYKGEGTALTLTVVNMTAGTDGAPGRDTIPGTWSVTFIENGAPGAPIDYTQGGRIAPEIVQAGELSVAVAGPPGGQFIKLIIDRAGEQDALYGIAAEGAAQPLGEAEFRQLLQTEVGTTDFPPPPEFPAPALIQ